MILYTLILTIFFVILLIKEQRHEQTWVEISPLIGILLSIFPLLCLILVLQNKLHLMFYLCIYLLLILITFKKWFEFFSYFLWLIKTTYLFTLSLAIVFGLYELIALENAYLLLNNPLLVALLFISGGLLFLTFERLFITYIEKKHIHYLHTSTHLLVPTFILLFLLILKITYLHIYFYTSHSLYISLGLILALILELLVMGYMFYFIHKTYQLSIYQFQAEALNFQYEQKAIYYKQLEKTQLTLRRFSHDFHHHQFVLKHYLEQEQYDQALHYLTEVEVAKAELDQIEVSAHPILQALVVEKIKQCDHAKISFTHQLTLPQDLPIVDYDLCILIGNLLDNAYEASQVVTNHQPYIHIHAKQLNHHLIFRVQNAYDTKLKKHNGQFITSKSDSLAHGLGLLNVEQIVAKYKGTLHITTEDNCFDVTAIIPL